MIGHTVLNVKTGGARTRISTVVAGVFLLLATGLSSVMGQIPMAALAAVMMVVAITTVVRGPLFFGSSNDLIDRFSYADDPARVTIDLSHAQIWDASTVAALDSIETKYRAHHATVTIQGLDERSTDFHQRLTGRFGV